MMINEKVILVSGSYALINIEKVILVSGPCALISKDTWILLGGHCFLMGDEKHPFSRMHSEAVRSVTIRRPSLG